ncbi:MAG: NAD(P)/FAD-dependent oxidoreductase [Stappiaceae bacterium]
MRSQITCYDVLIVGAGAAGLMCAQTAAARGKSVLLIDHAKKPGEKIRISGGGRCNFTNIHSTPKNFLSGNPHFCISALKRYGPNDFIELVNAHQIAFHEKTLGQLFCDHSAKDIIEMLTGLCNQHSVEIWLDCKVRTLQKQGNGFEVITGRGMVQADSLVIASGGKSIPKMGASGFAYEVAAQFDIDVTPTRAGLVPFTFSPAILEEWKALPGIATDCTVDCGAGSFSEAMLFTHRGLSGPAMLQISNYWREGDTLTVNLSVGEDLFLWLRNARQKTPKQDIHTALSQLLPKRFAEYMTAQSAIKGRLADQSDSKLQHLADCIQSWKVTPLGTEGYRTAEVTLGGIDTKALSSKTMAVNAVPNLYFIGEAVDVTGHLGGHNFQWAWSSGVACGQSI